MLWMFLACTVELGGEKIEDDTAWVSDSDTESDTDTDADSDTDTDTDTDTDSDTDADSDSDTDTIDPFEQQSIQETIFKSSHNSYTGGEKGSIIEQLDAGIRSIELDVHDDDYTSLQSYRIGHGSMGSEVSLGSGNPSRYHLEDWLEAIADWSDEYSTHSIITVVLDIKDNCTDNYSYAEGNMAALNDLVADVFATDLLLPDDWNDWPTVGETRGKVQVVLSGDSQTRQMYKRDRGENPAVAINDYGHVIAVHDSGTGYLWYWTGQALPNGQIDWKRHGRYDTGQLPSIALNNQGWFVEVHQSESSSSLWTTTGYLSVDYEFIVLDNSYLDAGQAPTVAFTNLNGSEVREIHNSPTTGLNWDWYMTLNTSNGSLQLQSHDQTSDAKYPKDISSSLNNVVSVWTGADGNAGTDTLLYSTNQFSQERIRYPQVMHVEYQRDDAYELSDGETYFCAVSTGDTSPLQGWSDYGCMNRVWSYSSNDIQLSAVHFPATDEPLSAWYQGYFDSIGAAE